MLEALWVLSYASSNCRPGYCLEKLSMYSSTFSIEFLVKPVIRMRQADPFVDRLTTIRRTLQRPSTFYRYREVQVTILLDHSPCCSTHPLVHFSIESLTGVADKVFVMSVSIQWSRPLYPKKHGVLNKCFDIKWCHRGPHCKEARKLCKQ